MHEISKCPFHTNISLFRNLLLHGLGPGVVATFSYLMKGKEDPIIDISKMIPIPGFGRVLMVLSASLAKKLIDDSDRGFRGNPEDIWLDKGSLIDQEMDQTVGHTALASMAQVDPQYLRTRELTERFFKESLPAGTLIHDHTETLINRWQDTHKDSNICRIQSLLEEFQILTLTILADLQFNIKVGYTEASAMNKIVRSIPKTFFWNSTVGQIFPSMKRNFHQTEGYKYLSDLFKVGGLHSSFGAKTSALGELNGLDNWINFVFAGSGTTATTLACLFHNLSGRPELYSQIRSGEIDLRHAIWESLRIHPALWAFTRNVVREREVEGYNFKMGDTLFFSPYYWGRNRDPLHRNNAHYEKVFADLHVYDPARFRGMSIAEAEWFWSPFGIGRRKCVARALALEEILTIASTIISKGDLYTNSKFRAGIHPTSSPVRPLNFKYHLH